MQNNPSALEEAVSRVRGYVAAYEDVPNWGGPPIYPDAPKTTDLRLILDALAARQEAGDEVERLRAALDLIASWGDEALGHWSCSNDMRETARKACGYAG